MSRRLLGLVLALIAATAVLAGVWWLRPGPRITGVVPAAGDFPDWHRHHAGFVAASHAGTLEVVVLGDSISRGWEDHRDVWAERVTGRPTGFFAINGDTTNHLLWRLDHGELDGPPPKLVVVLIGANNWMVNGDPADVAAGVAAVVGRVRARAPTARVLVLGILPQEREPTGRYRTLFAAANARLAALGDDRRVFVRDPGVSLLEPDGTLSERVSDDGLHLTRAGYLRLADALGPVVRTILDE